MEMTRSLFDPRLIMLQPEHGIGSQLRPAPPFARERRGQAGARAVRDLRRGHKFALDVHNANKRAEQKSSRDGDP